MAKILIAEDERDIRDLISFTLRYAGHEVIATADGAEAVETVAQADILRAMGCDTVQGFIFSPPMFEEEYLAWIRSSDGAKSVA